MNKVIFGLVIVAILVIAAVVYSLQMNNKADYQSEQAAPVATTPAAEPVPEEATEPGEEKTETERKPETRLGESVAGHDIMAFHYGSGDKEILLVGGVHGGYSANTSVLMTELMDEFTSGDISVPDGYTVTIVPTLNPDGLNKVFDTTDASDVAPGSVSAEARTPGRFNSNEVDLNRNFDCEWKSQGVWQSRAVSGGDEPFSEPESQAIRDYVNSHDIAAAVVYYSAEGAVYASQCNNGTLPETVELTAAYASAAGYDGKAEFDFYAITGDMVNWLAKSDIPAISVLLTDYVAPETVKNQRGVEAVLEYLAE